MRFLDLLLFYVEMYIHPAIVLVSLLLGIIIICRKEKVTKFLGVWISFEAVNAILEGIRTQIMRYGDMQLAARSAVYFRIAGIAVLGIAGFALFLYAKYRYGTKNVVGVLVVVTRVLLTFLLPFLCAKIIDGNDFKDPTQYALCLNCINLIPTIIVGALLFSVYYKNRSKEEDMKLLWTSTLFAILYPVLKLVMHLIAIVRVADHHNETEDLLLIGNLFLSVVFMFVLPLFAIYILACGRRSFRLPEQKLDL